MNICIPVTHNSGLESPVCAHFGSAPMFMIVDTDSDACRAIDNTIHRNHGECQPLVALSGEKIDGFVVACIGPGALNKIMATGIPVYLTKHPTVGLAVDACRKGTLVEFEPSMTCGDHDDGHGGGHDRGHGCRCHG